MFEEVVWDVQLCEYSLHCGWSHTDMLMDGHTNSDKIARIREKIIQMLEKNEEYRPIEEEMEPYAMELGYKEEADDE